MSLMIDEMLLSGLLKLGFGLMILVGGIVIGFVIGTFRPYIFDGELDEIDDDEVFYGEDSQNETETMPRSSE